MYARDLWAQGRYWEWQDRMVERALNPRIRAYQLQQGEGAPDTRRDVPDAAAAPGGD